MRHPTTRGISPLVLLAALSSSATSQRNPVPLVNQPLVPAAVLPGGPGFTLTVNGTGFTSESVVQWNGCVRETSFVSSSRLTATILESDVSTPGTASVTVFTPSPGGGTSNLVFLQITNPCSVELTESQVGTG